MRLRRLESGRCMLAGLIAASFAGRASAGSSPADDATFLASRRIDPHGLTFLQPERRRTPTGFLYPYPFAPPEWRPIPDGFLLRGFASVGGQASWGAGDEAYFDEYADYDDGPLAALRTELLHAQSGGFLELGAQDPLREDGGAFLEAGLPGRLRLGAFYDQTPHRYANDARTIHDGIGGDQLVLRTPLVPSGSAPAGIDAVLASTEDTSLRVSREEAGVEVRFSPVEGFGLNAGYLFVEQEGSRPFGGAIRFAFQNPNLGSVIETVEPRESHTHDFHAGLSFSQRWLALELGYEGQIFDNENRSLTWENPFALPGVAVDRGRQALAPDNVLHRARGTLAWIVPGWARWTHAFSWTTARQDERLLAPTLTPSFPDWTDPQSALSRTSAGARTDRTVFDSSLHVTPLKSISLDAGFHYRARDNRTGYLSYNPALDDYAYVVEDGNLGLRPRFGAAPFDEERWGVDAAGAWNAPARTRLSLEVRHEEIERDERARRETRETTGRLSLTSRGLSQATVTLSYELSRQGGSRFDRTRGAEFYSSGPPDFALPPIGTPQRSLIGFESVDLADRMEQRGNARVVLLVGDVADLALAGRLGEADYDVRYGVRSSRSADVQVELGLQYSPALDGYAFAGFEWRRRRLVTIAGENPGSVDLEPGGNAFPFDAAWSLGSEGRVVSAGGGLSARPIERLELRADYSFLSSRERLGYDFGDGALAPGVTAEQAGSGLPDLRNVDHILDASAELTLADGLSLRLAYHLHAASFRDFTQTGLARRIGHAVYLGHVDEGFVAHVVGAALKLRF